MSMSFFLILGAERKKEKKKHFAPSWPGCVVTGTAALGQQDNGNSAPEPVQEPSWLFSAQLRPAVLVQKNYIFVVFSIFHNAVWGAKIEAD